MPAPAIDLPDGSLQWGSLNLPRGHMMRDTPAPPFSSWRDIFESETPTAPGPSTYKPALCPRFDPSKPLSETSYIAPRLRVGDVTSGDRGRVRFYDVVVTPGLVDWVREHMLDIERNDFYFEALIWPEMNPATARVWIKYDLIIGSRLLAEIPMVELPEVIRAQ